MLTEKTIRVTSETGILKRVLIHSPDSGLGKVVPSKAQDWLFEDIVHLDSIRRNEYDYYVKLLLYFLDPEKIRGRLAEIDDESADRNFYKPDRPEFHASACVVELQWLLAHILEDDTMKGQLVASVCAMEATSFVIQQELMQYPAAELSKIFFSGTSPDNRMLFPPVPNFIFTRDIGTVINGYILLNKPAKQARKRDALLVKYVLFHHPLFDDYREHIIELTDTQHHFLLPDDAEGQLVTLEGGDLMVISADHLLVGVSERTSREAARQVVKTLFSRQVVKKITVIEIPRKRDYMHIDTVFTQVKKGTWVMLGDFAENQQHRSDTVDRLLQTDPTHRGLSKIIQFHRSDPDKPVYFENLEKLLVHISVQDLGVPVNEVQIIFSGNGEFPYDAREQWTDSCNLLALKDGVVLGYDRNDKTTAAFKKAGFSVIPVADLLHRFENGSASPETLHDTLILMPSAELSRARGGFHCMSMPLLRLEDEAI